MFQSEKGHYRALVVAFGGFLPFDGGMLRYMAHGWRNFVEDPDLGPIRLNWEFFAVLEGECGPCFVGEKKEAVKFRESTLWLMPPWAQYVWKGRDRKSLRAVFHLTSLPQIMLDHLPQDSYYEIPISKIQGQKILRLAKDFESIYYHPDESYELHESRLVSELCLMVTGNVSFRRENPLYHVALEKVQMAEDAYRKNMHRSPSVEEVAKWVGISASQLRRHFQHIRHTSPQLIFRGLRLQYACYLMWSKQTLDMVAEKAGFKSKRDFHRVFKNNFGVTPHYWRMHENESKLNDYMPDMVAKANYLKKLRSRVK